MNKKLETSDNLDGLTHYLLTLRNRHFLAIDFLFFCITPVLAMWLRVDNWDFLSKHDSELALYVLVAALIRFSVFVPLGLYARYWRYASIDELVQITLAVATATSITMLCLLAILNPLGLIRDGFPRSLPLIDGLLTLLAVGGSRFSIRLVDQLSKYGRRNGRVGKAVLIFGAGNAGTMIVKEMQANAQLGLIPVVFLDKDPRKQGTTICGVPVIGGREKLRVAIESFHVQQAIIAMPTAPGKMIREITRLCQEVNLPVKTIPGMFELLDGSVTVNQLRSVDIADLLRREPVVTDVSKVLQLLQGKRVLVTGAGGSIGSELCRQIARCHPAQLILLGHGENSLFQISNELRLAYSQLELRVIVADVRDTNRIRVVFERHQPQVVFHAAAHKHVPLMEENVEDAVTNNIVGTRNVVWAAQVSGVAQLVLISSDKAVNPSSVMGATKRVAELLVHDAAARTGRCFVAVRFGNVLDSRGSVVPFFRQQIAQGGPLTVTHPEVKRYFMLIPEAVQLVLQAATLGKGGEIFTLDMGEPIKIVDLARDLIRLSGLKEGQDIDIVFTGLRSGEKLFEELFLAEEIYERTSHQKIFVTRNGIGMPESFSPDFKTLDDAVSALVAAAQMGDVAAALRLMKEIVPDYNPARVDVKPCPDSVTSRVV